MSVRLRFWWCMAQAHWFTGLACEVIRAVGFEVGLGGEIPIVGGKGARLAFPDTNGPVTLVQFGCQALVHGSLEKQPRFGGIVICIFGRKIRAMAVVVILQRTAVAPGLFGGRRGIGRLG